MRFVRSERGVSALEFALVLPVLLLITFVIIEYGIIFYDKVVLINASREGARAGIVYATNSSGTYAPVTATAIRTVVKNYANGLLINLGGTTKNLADSNITVSCKVGTSTTWTNGICPTDQDDMTLRVQVQYTYNFLIVPDLSAMTGGAISGTIPMSAETAMRMEFSKNK